MRSHIRELQPILDRAEDPSIGGLRFLVQFNTEYQVLFDKPIANAPTLSYLTSQPNGRTALSGAVGHTIDSIDQRLASMPESQRPNEVIFDGLENSKGRYSRHMSR